MAMVISPDSGQLERWLTDGGLDYYICEHCHGLHLSDMQNRDGVLDSRLFVEDEGLLLTTELEVKPSALLMAQADTPRLNMLYPGLKVFLDINDETLPRMVLCDMLLTGAGINPAQFVSFLRATLRDTAQLHEECARLGYLYDGGEPGDEDDMPLPGGALH